jgi:Fe2+ transport system protein FeoA
VRRADVGGLIELEVRRSRVTLRRSEASLLLLAES